MHTVLGSTLSNTRVMSTDGQELGTLHNITFETTDGGLAKIIIETDERELFGKQQDEDGYVRLSAGLVDSLSDHLLLRPPEKSF